MQIKDRTGVKILYNENALRGVRCGEINLKGATVEDALQQVLAGTAFDFEIVEGVIVIRERLQAEQTVAPESVVLKGIVRDEKGQPVPGVTVMIKGTGMGVVTDAEGNYTLQLPDAQDIRLLFSFVGMKTQEVAYIGQKEVNITMYEEAEQMDEVVVTGYQVVDRRKNTSAVQTVKVDDIMIPSATSIDQMLEGRVTDMMLMTNSGEVGVAPKIRIRGTSTLVGNREPLWVVDGIIVQDPVPVSAEELNDPDYVNRIGNAIAGLNPQDIERLDILKDAAATALYGTKAANGVIVITTKKGHVGAPIINYNMTTTLRQRPRYSDRKIDLMNSKERIQFSRELFQSHYKYDASINYVGYEGLLHDLYTGKINDKQFAVEVAKLETVNTDWFDLLTEDSWSHQHTLSMSGGSDKTRYYASIGYSRDNDVIKNNHTQRYTAALNLESTLTKWLTASFQMQGNVGRREYSQDGLSPIDYAYNASRAIPAYDENGEYAYYQKRSGNSDTYKYNVLNELDNSYKQQHTSALTVTTNLKFNFTDWLNANAIVSYNTSNANIEGYWGDKTFYAAELRGSEYGSLPGSTSQMPFGGELSNSETRNQSYTVRLQLNANKYFGADEQHNINASAGYEMSSTRYNGISTLNRGYYADRGKAFVNNLDSDDYPDYAAWMLRNVPTITDNLSNTVSGYATLSYSYQNYFTLNINGRVDGSNKFGSRSNDRFLPIWSASGVYNFSEHQALYADWIDMMSLKVSYGFQGNMLDESPVLTIRKLPINSYWGEMESEMVQYPN
ncbi:MAG: SusC/RagA family TonB-linked outer membrane protein, partial [Odoribacter sp.]|nr:SusC/RagA family TonB-linked outer membrane protein [Odoribacter sp.]